MNKRKIYWILSVVLIWITCTLLFNYFYNIEKKIKITEINEHQRVHARLAIRNFEQLFSKWNNVLYYLSIDRNVVDLNDTGKDDLIKLTSFFKNEIKGVTRTNASGKIFFTYPANPNAIGSDISGQKHVKKLLADHEPVVSDVFTAVQGYQAIVIHFPVFKDKKFYGSVAVILDFAKISKDVLDEIKIGKSGAAWMLSSDSIELFCKKTHHIGNKIDTSHTALQTIVDSMLSGKAGLTSYESNSQIKNNRKFAAYFPIKITNTFWSLAITYSEDEITESLSNFRNRLLFILSFVFISGIILSYYGIKAWIIIKESQLRRLAEKNLKESEEKYRIVIETTDTGYAITDKAGAIVDANDKFAEMAGFSSIKKIAGKTLNNWTSNTDYERFRLLIGKCLNEGRAHHLELGFKQSDGTVLPVEINASKVNTGNEDQIIMLCRNISERRKAKEQLMKERSLLRTLIDHLPSGVFIKDIDYRKIIANQLHTKSVQGHLRRKGLKSDIDICGKTDFEIFTPEEATMFQTDDSRVIEKGEEIINQVEPGWGPNDESIWLLVSKVPIKAEDGSVLGMVGITTDITEQQMVAEQLTLAKEKAEQSDKLKTAFLNNISHEIRTPLNAITGFSGFLKDPAISLEKRNNFVNIITESSNQLLSIITDIINIATIEAGQIKINYSIVDINSILNILYQQYSSNAHLKNLTLSYSQGLRNADSIIETDGTKFLEVLSNLINNAIKFTNQGSVNYGYKQDNDNLLFFVEDTGIGIKPEHQAFIFDRFWQADDPLSQSNSGTGLGLSISRTYVELMGGKIWLTSEPGSGTTFYFTLPYIMAEVSKTQ